MKGKHSHPLVNSDLPMLSLPLEQRAVSHREQARKGARTL
jgi:hypothetical protein